MRVQALLLALTVLTGCGDDDVSDASVDSNAPDLRIDAPIPVMVEAPTAPLVDCPSGWTAHDGVCAAFEGDLPTCTGATGLFPGESECVPVGTCPAGDWPENLPEGDVVFVRPGSFGPGTRDNPMDSIERAFRFGTTVVLSEGVYTGDVDIPDGGKLIGLCPEKTIVRPFVPNDVSITIRGDDVTVQDLTIQEGVGILTNRLRGKVMNVVIDGAREWGVGAISGSAIELTRVVIRNTQVTDMDSFGNGLIAATGSRITGNFVSLIGNKGQGAAVTEGSTLTLSDSLIAQTGPHYQERFGEAISADEDAHVDLKRVAAIENTSCGITLTTRSSLTAKVLQVSGTRPRVADSLLGCGINAKDAGLVQIEDALISNTLYYGIGVFGGNSFSLRNSVVEGVSTNPVETKVALGIASVNSQTQLSQVRCSNFAEAGILVRGGRAVLSDVSVSDTIASGLLHGQGLIVDSGATTELERVTIQRAKYAGAFVTDFGSTLSGTDLKIVDTGTRPCEVDVCAGRSAGDGLVVLRDASAELSSFEIVDSARSGVYIDEGANAHLSKGTIASQPVGVFVIDSAYDVMKISQDVIYDNDRNFVRERVAPPEKVILEL